MWRKIAGLAFAGLVLASLASSGAFADRCVTKTADGDMVNPLSGGGQPGQLCSCGSDCFCETWTPDSTEYCLKEALVGGKARLERRFVFLNVPAGTQYLSYTGRKGGTESFSFLFNINTICSSAPNLPFASFNLYSAIPGATINSTTPVSNTVALGLTTTSPTNIYVLVRDDGPNTNDTNLDQVFLDYMAIETDPCPVGP